MMSSPWAVLSFQEQTDDFNRDTCSATLYHLKPGMQEGDGEWWCAKNMDSGGRQVL